MIEELFIDVNWAAVVIGAIAAFALGALWYSPKMFGAKWSEGVGLSPGNMGSTMPAMIAQGVGTFLLAWVIGITETTDALAFAILIALTMATLIKANGLWTNKSKYAIIVESGFILAMVVVMILAHVIF